MEKIALERGHFWLRKEKLLVAYTKLLCTFLMLALAPHALANQEGITAFKENDFVTAKSLFLQRLNSNTENSVGLHYLAKIAMFEGALDDAEKYIKQALKLAPASAENQFLAAHVFANQAMNAGIFRAPGYASKTLKAYQAAATLDPSTVLYRKALMNFYLRAPVFLGGSNTLALKEAEAIAALEDLQGRLAMASYYQNTGKEEKLEALYATAQQQYPDSPHIYFHRGKYRQAQRKFDLAIADFVKVQSLKPEQTQETIYFAALYEIGLIAERRKGYREDGIKALRSFIDEAPYHERLPSKAWAMYLLGLLIAKSGDGDTAISLYRKALIQTKDKKLLKKLQKKLRRHARSRG